MTDIDILNELNRDYIQSVQTSNVQRFEELLADDFLCSPTARSSIGGPS